MDHKPQEPKVSMQRNYVHFKDACIQAVTSHVFRLSFDGIVLVTQSHDTLPPELECLKAPLQDYSSVRLHSRLTFMKSVLT